MTRPSTTPPDRDPRDEGSQPTERSQPDCGGTEGVTTFCAKQTKHAKVGSLRLATTLTRDPAATVKPLELCVPSTLAGP
jgi:hypothetical protein